MSKDEEYNGWSNRETWAINLHLSNNEGDYLAMREAAKDFVIDESRGIFELCSARDMMAEHIKDWTEQVFDSVLQPIDQRGECVCHFTTNEARSFVSDVGSWWRADFYEIAEHWIDEAREELGIEDEPEREDDSHFVMENG